MTKLLLTCLYWSDRLHWLWLGLAAPFLLFPTPKRTVAMLVVPAIWLLHWIAGRAHLYPESTPRKGLATDPPIPLTALNGAILLMMFMVLVSTWATYDLRVSLPKISGMVLGVGAYFAVVREAQGRTGWWRVLGFYLASGLGIAAIGMLGMRWVTTKLQFINPIIERIPQLVSGLQGAEAGIHPNEVGGALTWVVPITLTLSVYLVFPKRSAALQPGDGPFHWAVGWWANSRKAHRWGVRLSWWLATLFVCGVFVLAQSRAGYMGVLFACLALALAPLAIRRMWVVLGLLISGGLVTGVLLWWQEMPQRWFNQWRMGMYGWGTLSVDSVVGRLEIWFRAIYAIQDFSFTGMGMNTFREVVKVLYPISSTNAEISVGHAHNEFLQAGLDLGIPGLIALLALYFGAFGILIYIGVQGRSLGSGARGLQWAVLLGLGGNLLAHMAYGLVDAVALGAKPGILFWLLLGLIAGLQTQPALSALPGSPIMDRGEA